jgi:hypothetical protein
MTIRGIAARPERNSQGLWISVSCGVSVAACRFVGSFDEDAVLKLRARSDQRDKVGGRPFQSGGAATPPGVLKPVIAGTSARRVGADLRSIPGLKFMTELPDNYKGQKLLASIAEDQELLPFLRSM